MSVPDLVDMRNLRICQQFPATARPTGIKKALAAGEADMRLFRREVHLVNPRVLPRGHRRPRASVDRPAAGQRRVGLFVADIA
jgi:hypothetical protein